MKTFKKISVLTLLFALVFSMSSIQAWAQEGDLGSEVEIEVESSIKAKANPRSIPGNRGIHLLTPDRRVQINSEAREELRLKLQEREQRANPRLQQKSGDQIPDRQRTNNSDFDRPNPRQRDYVGSRIKAEHEFEDGTHTVSGTINLPTPCHSFETRVLIAESFPEQVTIEFNIEAQTNEDLSCIQVIKPTEFEVQFDASQNASISFRIDGQRIRAFSGSDDRGINQRDRRIDNGGLESGSERSEEAREERQERINERAKERIEAYFERMGRRIEAAFDRMERLMERMESRIEKMEELGLETEAALELLAEAEVETAEGRAQFEASLEAALEQVLDAENPRELFVVLKDEIKSSVDSLREARRILSDAVQTLKAEVSTTGEVNTEIDDTETDTENNEGEDNQE